MPVNATSADRSRAYQIDSDMKREAHRLRKLPTAQVPADARRAMSVLDDAVRHAFLAT